VGFIIEDKALDKLHSHLDYSRFSRMGELMGGGSAGSGARGLPRADSVRSCSRVVPSMQRCAREFRGAGWGAGG
jgi:hypothetical protein